MSGKKDEVIVDECAKQQNTDNTKENQVERSK